MNSDASVQAVQMTKPMNHPAVEVANVVKTYRVGHTDYPALRGVSFKIEKGELASIIGPSGSGKSTVLNLIGALDRPTSGKVFVDGINLRKLDEDRLAILRNRKIGFIYQSFNLIQRLTSLENVEMPLISRGTPEKIRRAKAAYMLKMVGLGNKLNKKPNELSGGEQQRVAVARAIVGGPSIVLADEPTAALDSENGHAVMTVLAEIARDPARALFIVTHDPRIIPFASRILRIEDGRIVSEQQCQRLGTVHTLKYAS